MTTAQMKQPSELEARILLTLLDGEEHDYLVGEKWNPDGGSAVDSNILERYLRSMCLDGWLDFSFSSNTYATDTFSGKVTLEGRCAFSRSDLAQRLIDIGAESGLQPRSMCGDRALAKHYIAPRPFWSRLSGLLSRSCQRVIGRWRFHLTALLCLLVGSQVVAQTLTLDCLLPDGQHYIAKIDGSKPWVTFQCPPTGSPKDSEILGVNVYTWDVLARDRSGQPMVIGAQLLLSNAFANADGTDHCGAVYFRSMTADAGKWGVSYDVRRWPAPYVIGPPPEGGDHLWLSGQCTVRRVVLFRDIGEARARAMLDDVPEQDAGQTELTDGIAYPALDAAQVAVLEARAAKNLSTFRTAFAAGTTTDNTEWLRDPRIGFLQPTGNTTIAYEQGGDRIFFPWGWQRTRSTALLLRAWTDAGAERQRIFRDRRTGRRLTTEAFADAFAAGKGKGQRFQPFSMFLTGNAEYFDSEGRHISLPPCFDVPKFNFGNCKREGEIRARQAHDVQHLIRVIGPQYGAARSIGPTEVIARELLLDEANSCRLAFSDLGEPPSPGRYQSGLPVLYSRMKTPGQGVPSFGRGEGWALTAIGWAASMAGEGNPEIRPLLRTGRALMKLRELAAPPTGIAQRESFGGIASAWDPVTVQGGAADKKATLAQSFEAAIMNGGEGVFGDESPPNLMQLTVAYHAGSTLYDNPNCPTHSIPWKYLDVGPVGGPAATVVTRGWNIGGSAYGDPTHVKRSLGWLYIRTGEEHFLDLLRGSKTLKARIAEELKYAVSGDTSVDPDGCAEAAAIMQYALVESKK